MPGVKKEQYELECVAYEKLKNEVLFILDKELTEAGITIHELTGRVKTVDSFVEKANRLECENPLEDITDICGVRVICLFLSDLKRIGEIIERCFRILETDDKVYSEPDAFGYLSMHYIGKIPEEFAGARYDVIKELRFEVQVRTIAMHAWASISHFLDYKSPMAIPSQLRKDFNALSAMFYVADTHFEMFFRQSEEDKQIAEEKASTPALGLEEINYNTMAAYLSSRYADRKENIAKAISKLVDEVREHGYETIEQLDEVLRKSEKAFLAYERKSSSSRTKGSQFAPVGVVRCSLAISDADYRGGLNKSEEGRKLMGRFRHLIE